MLLSEYIKAHHESLAEFARQQGETRQRVEKNIKAGYVVDMLHGKRIYFNPKHIKEINKGDGNG